MKKNKTLLIVLVILLAVAAYFFATKNSNTLKTREGVLSDFAIEDTTTIDKIFIGNSTGENVTLTKGSGNDWIVDGKNKARPESISILMKTFARIAVKSPVSSAAFKNVVTSIATQSVKVEIYQGNDQPSKVYYVGESTQNHQGTYMLLEKAGVKSTEPFVMYIPGFYGYLTTRFYSNPLEWRDAAVFKYLAGEIKEIKVDYFKKPEESFTIKQNGLSTELYNNQTSQLVENFDSLTLKTYLSFFDKAYYEGVVLEMEQTKKDSIIASEPYFSIRVTDIFGKENKMVGYFIPNRNNPVSEDGTSYPYDLDRMYGYFNDELLVYIQYNMFDKYLLPKSYFNKK
ncbi:hypothetical protein FRY74_02465 [Vicingus serpentipes]|uniref:DUF4340 domain-containing protein n=1 Tax=Vicingus serpentipes TaxID=1926625 RepID=A0A5C6RZ57_9FLAO|nr:DUF4340 domain-containing protein [Vicingus serpentipes]TXB67069.1 hypothetical protein FRY74_02465 [Vicingus serpentipes]